MNLFKKIAVVVFGLLCLPMLLTSCKGRDGMTDTENSLSEEATTGEEESMTEDLSSQEENSLTLTTGNGTTAVTTTQKDRTTEKPGSTNQTLTQTTQKTTTGVKTPQTKKEWVNAYNQALSKKTLKCTSSSQKVSRGIFGLADNENASINILDPDQSGLLALFQRENISGVTLPKLTESEVASVKQSGNSVVFTLNTATSENTISQGKGGYVALVDDARINELVANIKDYLNVPGSVKISSVSHKLSGGTLTVTFNADYTAIQSVKYAAEQSIQAKLRYLVFTINGDMAFRLTANFQ